MCTRYAIINRVSELKVHIELTRFVQPEKIEIDANERAVNEKSQYCFFVCTTFDSFLNDLSICFIRGSNLSCSEIGGQIICIFPNRSLDMFDIDCAEPLAALRIIGLNSLQLISCHKKLD